jgi:tRNA pseudouridine38-40 synthase
MVVAYDGSAFRGFAPQPDLDTVGGALTATIAQVTGQEVELTCAGRTDAGVHAWGQVVSFALGAPHPPLDRLQRSINKLRGPELVVRELTEAPPDFDARFSARSRIYRYTVLNRPVPDPFLARTAWWVSQPLDRHALILACDPFIGEHDFTSFCKRDKGRDLSPPSMRRRVYEASWEEGADDGVLHLWIEANAFCHQMVRAVVGTMVDAGRGKLHAGDILALLRARDRSAAGTLAPPQGLCLWEVRYEGRPRIDARAPDAG